VTDPERAESDLFVKSECGECGGPRLRNQPDRWCWNWSSATTSPCIITTRLPSSRTIFVPPHAVWWSVRSAGLELASGAGRTARFRMGSGCRSMRSAGRRRRSTVGLDGISHDFDNREHLPYPLWQGYTMRWVSCFRVLGKSLKKMFDSDRRCLKRKNCFFFERDHETGNIFSKSVFYLIRDLRFVTRAQEQSTPDVPADRHRTDIQGSAGQADIELHIRRTYSGLYSKGERIMQNSFAEPAVSIVSTTANAVASFRRLAG
jgi:hypothetical protein